jgi:hypothetical protein
MDGAQALSNGSIIDLARVVVAAALIDTLVSLNLAYPEVGPDRLKELAAAR